MHNAQSSGPESGTATGSTTGIDTCTRTAILSPISARCSGYGVASSDNSSRARNVARSTGIPVGRIGLHDPDRRIFSTSGGPQGLPAGMTRPWPTTRCFTPPPGLSKTPTVFTIITAHSRGKNEAASRSLELSKNVWGIRGMERGRER